MSDPARPRCSAEFRIAENDPAFCAQPRRAAPFTAHNATVTSDLALVTWYAGGLLAIDLARPGAPAKLAELRPEPLAAVAAEDPGLGGNAVEMWSYPVIKDGLIYVVDVRNGLYVLRYTGPHDEQVAAEDVPRGQQQPLIR